ncbi:CHAT domain-containing protein [Corallococcus sp. M34]|uniref:CHAT domain-containing protein n=1 Tax=Citreicoccus inhibens TaxID=2849499 RepID=UPI001C21DA38|nr:CHAT domain-containing protein [Citreicoccus inhibens]MBU8897558.1 CHAT domain-containing protein [Citreicoccus inhibens]
MSAQCQRLYLFVDGELGSVDEETFRHHLAHCEECASGLHDAMQLEVLGMHALRDVPVERAQPAEPPPVVVPLTRPTRAPKWSPAAGWRLGAGLALAAGLAAVVVMTRGPRDVPAEVWLADASTRTLEARVAYGAADHHHPYVPMRGERSPEAARAPLPLRKLADLQDRGDLHGIAAAYLVRKDLRQAADFLQRSPPSLDRDCDRAVIAMEQGEFDEALALLDGVLRQRPGHPQSLWNRALVLRELGLTLQAAEAFDAVAKQGEPGWAEEAAVRARALRQGTLRRARAFEEAYASTRGLMTDAGAPLPFEEARRQPGIARLNFYDAVRAAPTRDAALRLLPLAEALDGVQGGAVLREYVQRVAARDFQTRGPLAREYAQLVLGSHPAKDVFVEALRRSGEDDLYLGALVYAGRVGTHLGDFTRIAQASRDPWLQLLSERELAGQESQASQWWKAESRLLAALKDCRGAGLAYRCLTLKKRLVDLYVALHRPADAYEQASSGWRWAKDLGEWNLEQQFLEELSIVARYRHSTASARAFLQESLARMPDDCEQRSFVHRNLAQLAWLDLRPEEARGELEQAARCGQALGVPGALVLADLARLGRGPEDARWLERTLVMAREGRPSPGEQSLLSLIEGQFELEREPPLGRRLLHSAISQAELLPDDTDARKARRGAYGALVADAGRASAHGEVLALMGAALRVDVPERCVLAVMVQSERTVVAARGANGQWLGHSDAGRTVPLGQDASGLVPASIQDALRGCPWVEVLALPPVQGLAGLLPVDFAWGYRVSGAGARSPAPSGAHLVVTGVEAPASLGLPKLSPLESPGGEDPRRIELRGAQATPSRVLSEMQSAEEVEIHAHGLFSPELSDASLVVLSPEDDGRYALTAADVRARKLSGAPLVLLAACGAARAWPFPHESFSLPVAFMDAGARAVLASTEPVPDSAGRFFESVRERIRLGAHPAIVLRDERQRWLAADPTATWVSHVLLFE